MLFVSVTRNSYQQTVSVFDLASAAASENCVISETIEILHTSRSSYRYASFMLRSKKHQPDTSKSGMR